VRGLRQALKIFPKLVILKPLGASDVINTYVRLKQKYGEDILVQTDIVAASEDDMLQMLDRLNNDESVHGIIVQLPLDDTSRTDEIVNAIAPHKDVDGLGQDARFDSATAIAINWLLAGYAVNLEGKKIAIVGRGRLVGKPLARMWQESGYDVTMLGKDDDVAKTVRESDVIVTATGVPHLITPTMLGVDAVVVDAGTASEDGVIVGDLDEAVRAREDLTITPEKGGVGPLTVAALFDNVIAAALATAKK
jgi:methylenetetrahydrofolate dehydrogenase (NADP+)/methenyltetrahydrofolate cyclohydrolase